MARRPSKHLAPPRPLATSLRLAEIKADGRWITQSMAGASAHKPYRCPGCDYPIPAGMAHIVVWPDTPAPGIDQAVDDRRHWHTACWNRRP